ncbi:MAG TPA: NADH-quinone oxidoreductase subunit NuoE [Candidatus Methylomirabilis sp.]|nr:NADH-quinone oxidoreductase subunit NuoE [Candidatus Methylomirabilis sp.]
MISEDTRRRFDELVKRYPEKRSVLIPMLHEVQAEVGYLSPDAIEWVAGYLGLSPADVMSVASFYDMLHLEPVGRHMIYVCHNLSCALLGAERLIRHLESRLGTRMGETTPDGRITLKRMECLAACGMGPAIQVDGVFHEHMTPEKLDALLESLQKDAGAPRV